MAKIGFYTSPHSETTDLSCLNLAKFSDSGKRRSFCRGISCLVEVLLANPFPVLQGSQQDLFLHLGDLRGYVVRSSRLYVKDVV